MMILDYLAEKRVGVNVNFGFSRLSDSSSIFVSETTEMLEFETKIIT